MNLKFERQKAVYKENASQMRALNEQMSRVPTASVTLTGGLWFAASQVTLEPTIKFGILLFAGLANLALIMACFRIRDVLQSYLEKMRKFYPEDHASGRPEKPLLKYFGNYSMISIYSFLMLGAAIISFGGAFSIYWPFSSEYRCRGIAIFIGCATLLFLAVFYVPKLFSARR